MFTSLKYFQMFVLTLLVFLLQMYQTRASATITKIYAYVGMPQVHLPCVAFERLGTAATPQIEAMWAKQEPKSYQMVIVKDKSGIKETFRQLHLGGSTIQPNASLRNDRFYGRVNVSQSYGLIINNVQMEDAGIFWCQYKNTETSASDESEVELIVFNERTSSNNTCNTSCGNDSSVTGNRTESNTTNSGNGDTNSDNHNKAPSCMIWQVLFGIIAGLLILVLLGGGVQKKCPTYFKRDRPTPQAGDGNIRNGHARRNGENVANEYAVTNVNGQSVPQVSYGNPRTTIAHPSEDLVNSVPNGYTVERVNEQSYPQVGDGTPRVASAHRGEGMDNSVAAGNIHERSITQDVDGSPRVLGPRFSQGSYVPNVYVNGQATDNCFVGDNGGVAMGNYILAKQVTKSNDLTSEL